MRPQGHDDGSLTSGQPPISPADLSNLSTTPPDPSLRRSPSPLGSWNLDDPSRTWPPNDANMKKLPRWARVALTVRCAQRVQPLFAPFWPDAPKGSAEIVDRAITLAADCARSGQMDEQHAAFRDELLQGMRSTTGYCDADFRSRSSYMAACFAYTSALEGPESSSSPYLAATSAADSCGLADANVRATYDAAAHEYLRTPNDAEALYEVADSLYDVVRARIVALVWRDYDTLLIRSQGGGQSPTDAARGFVPWTHETAVDPGSLGPLWPDGEPEWWPTTDTR